MAQRYYTATTVARALGFAPDGSERDKVASDMKRNRIASRIFYFGGRPIFAATADSVARSYRLGTPDGCRAVELLLAQTVTLLCYEHKLGLHPDRGTSALYWQNRIDKEMGHENV